MMEREIVDRNPLKQIHNQEKMNRIYILHIISSLKMYTRLSSSLIQMHSFFPLDHKPSSKVGAVNEILHDLLRNGDFAQNYMKGSKGMKIDNWFSLYNIMPNQVTATSARVKVLQSHSKHSKKHMSMKQHKNMDHLIFLENSAIVESKITEFASTYGIMVRETAETFGIITEDDKFRVVPKKGSVFILQADSWKITLYGDKLSMRNLAS